MFELGEGFYPQFYVTVNHCHGRFQVYSYQTRQTFRVVVVVVVVVIIIVIIVVDHSGRGNLLTHINAAEHVLLLE